MRQVNFELVLYIWIYDLRNQIVRDQYFISNPQNTHGFFFSLWDDCIISATWEENPTDLTEFIFAVEIFCK